MNNKGGGFMSYKLLSSLFYEDKNKYEELYNKRFNSENTYHISILIKENEAFFTISKEVVQLLTLIYKLYKELTCNINMLPGIALKQFKLKCVVDEIKLTNDLESVYSTRKEIKELIDPEKNKFKRLYGLVQKYIMLSESEEINIKSCKDIRTIYDDLVLNEILEEDKNNEPDGVFFRKEGVGVQSKNMKIIHRGVVPEENIIAYMDECIRLLNDTSVNPIISIAAVHYLVGYIHPFYDGNGRLNRYISSAFLSQELHPLVGYSISNTIKKSVDAYYKAFKICNDEKNKGDITPFIIYFMDVIYQSMLNLNDTLVKKVKQCNYYKEKISHMDFSDNAFELIYILLQNSLFGEDGLSVEQCSDIINMSVSTIRNYLSNFPDGLLLISKDGYKKLYDVNLDFWD